jgi:hypothetical protein
VKSGATATIGVTLSATAQALRLERGERARIANGKARVVPASPSSASLA